MRHVLVFDFDGFSGRAVLAHFDSATVQLEEIHTFGNEPVLLQGNLYWDVLHLFHEMKTGLLRASHLCQVECIGIDGGSTDFGLLDHADTLMANPLCFRHFKDSGYAAKAESVMDAEALYAETGILPSDSIPLFQLLACYDQHPQMLEQAKLLLPLPDLLAFFLTSTKTCERSSAAATALYDPQNACWSETVLHAYNIPAAILPPIVESGTIRGTLSESVCKELHLPPIPVAAVCGHRTPCIAFATPVKKAQHAMYIQCGVQSQCGTMLDAPICTPESARLGCRNDVGMDNKIFYGKSCAGLGLIQETRRYLHRCEQPYTYAELEALALKADPLQYFIDPDDPVFSTAGNLPLRVQEYCMRTGQGKPASLGAIIRCIYESLALKYRLTLETLESSTDTHFSAIYLVGSGTKDRLLCQMTADVCNLPVYAGPKEAAVFGNASMQLMALGAVVSHAYARSVIAASAPATVYAPRTDWFDAFARFQTLVQQKYVES